MKKKVLILGSIILAVAILGFVFVNQKSTPPAKYPGPVPAKQTPLSVLEQPPLEPEWPFTEGKSDSNTSVSSRLITKNYLLVYDSSGSMAEKKCAEGSQKFKVARAALKKWISSVPETANIGLIAFHNNGWTILPLGTGKDELTSAVWNISPGGNTPLGEAFSRGYKMLTNQALSQLGYGEYTLVTITDGQATDMRKLTTEVKGITGKTPIVVYTIGFCIQSRNHSLNQEGKTFYRSANKPDELREGLKDVLAESEVFDISEFN